MSRRATRRLVGAALLLGAWLAQAPARAAGPEQDGASEQRRAVAARWAPTIYQETRSRRDLMAAFDFDGDWDGENNAADVARYPLPAVVYATTVETATHWLVTYLLYHPVDAKGIHGHDHDTEHITLAVRKDGSPTGTLELMETRFHRRLFQYAGRGAALSRAADGVDGPIHFDEGGHPEVYVQRVGHGVCGGFSPPRFFDAFSLRCRHRQEPHIQKRGVVYRPAATAGEPEGLDDRTAGYALRELGSTLWPHARDVGPHHTFGSRTDYRGERCALFDCPQRIGARLGSARGHRSVGMPWSETAGPGSHRRGDAFFDPAYTLSRRLAFAGPFSTDYLFNPYLGVGTFD